MKWVLNAYDTFTELYLFSIDLPQKPSFVFGDELGEYEVKKEHYDELGISVPKKHEVSFTVEKIND